MNNIINNKFIIGFVSLFLTLYATLIAHKLPNNVIQFFDKLFFILFKLLNLLIGRSLFSREL